MEPVRILHIVNSLNRGGMESRIMDLYRHLDHQKFQYDFYVESGNPGMFDEEVVKYGGRVFLSKKRSKYNIPNFRSFYEFLKEHPVYKIVYAYNQWSGFYLREAKKCGVPYRIANARTSIQTRSLKNSVKKLVKLNVNIYATHKFAVSKKAAIWLFGEKAVDNGQVKVWPNAIDTEKYKFSEEVRFEVRDELRLGDAFTIIHVGNIKFEKNHPFLLRVFKAIKLKEPEAKLLLIGSGTIEKLTPLIDELGIRESVHYLGVRQDIPRLLQAGDVFVFPSYYEGFPGAVLEAEASGLPCIISDTITDEVVLTACTHQMPIDTNPVEWAKMCLNYYGSKRDDLTEVVKSAGFDIYDLVYEIEEMYTSIEDKRSPNE